MALTQITEKGIKDGEIINADINANAAIAGTKINPSFGSQNIATSGTIHSTGNQIKVEGPTPKFTLIDNDNNPDYEIQNNGGTLNINDITTGTTRFTINSSGAVDVAGDLTVGTAQILSNGNILLADSDKIKLGTGEDLQIYHDGSNSYLEDSGTGNIIIKGGSFSTLEIRATTNDAVLKLTAHDDDNTDWAIHNDYSNSNDLDIRFNNTRKMDLDTGGNLSIKGGLFLNGDTAAANELNDYEEGTWSPDPDDGNNVFSHGQEHGRYTKIGNVIHVTYSFNASLPGTSGFAFFINLPFQVKNFGNETNQGIGFSKGTGVEIQLEAQQGQSRMKLRSPSSGAALTPNSVGCTNNVTKEFRGAITYLTT